MERTAKGRKIDTEEVNENEQIRLSLPDPTLNFYTNSYCPFAQRTHIALIEKGLTYEEIEIDLLAKPSWIFDINPSGRVPAITFGDKAVYESLILNEWLEDQFPHNPLMPLDPQLKAVCRLWIDFICSHFVASFYKILYTSDDEKRAVYEKQYCNALDQFVMKGLHEYSRGGPYFLGKIFTLVDVAFIPFLERWSVLKHYRNFQPQNQTKNFQRFTEYSACVMKRESVRATSSDTHELVQWYKVYVDANSPKDEPLNQSNNNSNTTPNPKPLEKSERREEWSHNKQTCVTENVIANALSKMKEI